MTKKKTPDLKVVQDDAPPEETAGTISGSTPAPLGKHALGQPDPFSVPVTGVWLAHAQTFAGGSSSVLVGNQFSTQLGSSGIAKRLDLNPETGAVRVTMERQSGERFTAYLGAAAVLLSDAGAAK